jgi:hypothetical protein
MASPTDLVSAKYFTTPLESEEAPVSVDTPEVPSTNSQVMNGINNVIIGVIVVSLLTILGTWACRSASKSTTAADWFLWVAGSDKTWEEYQEDHVKKGNPRLKDEEMTWMQQLFNDAYAGNNR